MTAAAVSERAPRVLYVEDNAANARLVEKVLALRPGVELVSVATAAEALELLEAQRPDLVLLDLHLPDMHGRDVLGRIGGRVPVVVVSADARPDEIARLRAAGAREYLTKPIDVSRLLAVVDEVLGAGRGS